MPPSSQDKYVYFTVGLLKDSAALESFKQDALKHHMIDAPGQLMALRITEYYQMMNQGIVQPVVRVPAIFLPPDSEEQEQPMPQIQQAASSTAPATSTPASPLSALSQLAHPAPARSPHTAHPTPAQPVARQTAHDATGQHQTFISQVTGRMAALRQGENIVSTSPHVDQNADEAADYWSIL